MPIRIGFVDTFDPVPQFFMHMLDGLNMIRDDMNPQVLIFGDENFGSRNLDPKYDKCRKVFYTGENRRPYHYDCTAAITFDNTVMFKNPKNAYCPHYRLPLWVLNLWHYNAMGLFTCIGKREIAYTHAWRDIQGFASFVVSNPNCLERNEFFHKLNSYKQVDSAGPLFNNMNFVLPRGETGVKDKIDFLSGYMYNICFENSSYPGYVSEKLLDAHLAGTVPIYWGSPTVAQDFNPKAFINVHDFASFDDVIKHIDMLEDNPDLYMEMLDEDLLYDNNVVSSTKNRLQEWFEREVLCQIGEPKKT